jgi:hypothetical protein
MAQHTLSSRARMREMTRERQRERERERETYGSMQEKPTSRHFYYIAMIKWSKIRCPAQDHVKENNRVDERVRNMGVECSQKKKGQEPEQC